jgi:hypothetical protein
VPPGIAAVIGGSAHEAFELNFKQKLTTDEDLPLGDLEDCAATSYKEKLQDQGVFIPYSDLPNAKLEMAKGKDMAVAVCKPFKEDFAPQIQPLIIEQKMTLEIEGLPTIVGYPDLYTTNKRLSDSKTAGKKWGDQQVQTATQPTLYREMIKAATNEYPALMTIDQFVKTKEPYYHCAETTRTDDDFRILIDRFTVMMKMINAGIFPPSKPDSWWCSPKWCGLWYGCPAVPEHRKLLPKRSE